MKYFKKILKFAALFITSIIVFVILYLIAAFGFSKIKVNDEASNKGVIEIYIKTNGVHTDIVVPVKNEVKDWSTEVKFSNTKIPDSTVKYLAMGWGDKGFYLETPNWSDLKASIAFKAAFGLSSTAIHATFYHQISQDESCKKIKLSKREYEQLVRYISTSFQTDSLGHFILIKTNANYSNSDAFYEANGHYSLFKTCNTWANNALKSCNQKACFWTPFDKGIFDLYN
jgi:uncharacterized protein (TIGR02117 family)